MEKMIALHTNLLSYRNLSLWGNYAAKSNKLSVTQSHLCHAGILRYRVDFQGMEYQGEDDEFFDLDDY